MIIQKIIQQEIEHVITDQGAYTRTDRGTWLRCFGANWLPCPCEDCDLNDAYIEYKSKYKINGN